MGRGRAQHAFAALPAQRRARFVRQEMGRRGIPVGEFAGPEGLSERQLRAAYTRQTRLAAEARAAGPARRPAARRARGG